MFFHTNLLTHLNVVYMAFSPFNKRVPLNPTLEDLELEWLKLPYKDIFNEWAFKNKIEN